MNSYCKICGSSDIEVIYNKKFIIPKGIYLPDNYDLVVCKNCDFVFANTLATQSQYDNYYIQNNFYEGKAGEGDKERYNRLIKLLSKYLYKENSILDIGVANGDLLSSLKLEGFINLSGLDPSTRSIENLENLKIKGYIGSIFNNPISYNEKFDFIILSHVLEHLVDISLSIKILSLLLNKDGFIYFEVPDFSNYENNNIYPYNYFDLEHLNHFTSYSLKNLLEYNGMNVIELGNYSYKIRKGVYYPCIWAIAEKKDIYRDNNILSHRNKLLTYLELPNQQIINEFVKTQEKIIIWGTGGLVKRWLFMSNLSKCNISFFIDNDKNKQNKIFFNSLVKAPEEINENYTIIIFSVDYFEDISNQIKKLGLKNKIIII